MRAVDHSAIAIARGRAQKRNPARLRFEERDVLDALRATASSSVDVVYSHGLYMMLPDNEVDAIARGVFRVLRPGGLHLFAVRSTTDPMFGQGQEVAPDVWVRPPRPEPIHFYRKESLDRFTRAGFIRVEEELAADLALWYVCDRRPAIGAPGPEGKGFSDPRNLS